MKKDLMKVAAELKEVLEEGESLMLTLHTDKKPIGFIITKDKVTGVYAPKPRRRRN